MTMKYDNSRKKGNGKKKGSLLIREKTNEQDAFG
jgi:hypothetical protein